MDSVDQLAELTCPICFQCYNSKENAPRFLTCGHTHCTQCLRHIFKQQEELRKCGECRQVIKSGKFDTLSINYTVIRMLESIKVNDKDNEFLEVEKKLDNIITMFKERKNKFSVQTDYNKRMVNVTDDDLRHYEELKKNLSKKYMSLKSIGTLSGTYENLKAIMDSIKDIEKQEIIIKNRFHREDEIGRFQSVFDSPEDYFFTSEKGKGKTSCFIQNSVMYIKSFPQNFAKTRKIELKMNEFRPYISRTYIIITYNKNVSSIVEFELFDLEGTRAKHFLDMCLGEKRNYRGGKFYDHERKRREGESICFGHTDDNKSVNHVDNGCKKFDYIKTGYLTAANNTKNVNHFKIYLEGWPCMEATHCVGRVVRGLKILKSVLNNKLDVKISECGVVLNFAIDVDE